MSGRPRRQLARMCPESGTNAKSGSGAAKSRGNTDTSGLTGSIHPAAVMPRPAPASSLQKGLINALAIQTLENV